jgi:hypothetical protein
MPDGVDWFNVNQRLDLLKAIDRAERDRYRGRRRLRRTLARCLRLDRIRDRFAAAA